MLEREAEGVTDPEMESDPGVVGDGVLELDRGGDGDPDGVADVEEEGVPGTVADGIRVLE